MPDNIVRFRADEELLAALGARAHGTSLGETARRDLAAYYARLAQEQWPETWKRLQQALLDLHHVAFDATEAAGCRARRPVTAADGAVQTVPLFGNAGLLASLELMAARGLLDDGDLAVYRRLETVRERVGLEPQHVLPLGESRAVLYEIERLKQCLLRFVPETRP